MALIREENVRKFIWLHIFMRKYKNIVKKIFLSGIQLANDTQRGWTVVNSYPIPAGASGLAYDGTRNILDIVLLVKWI